MLIILHSTYYYQKTRPAFELKNVGRNFFWYSAKCRFKFPITLLHVYSWQRRTTTNTRSNSGSILLFAAVQFKPSYGTHSVYV